MIISVVLFVRCGTPQQVDWAVNLGDKASSQYAPIDQVTPQNVKQLRLAWQYQTGDKGDRTQIQCNPIIIDGIMYGTTPKLKVFAVNAATGEEIWRYDPAFNDTYGLNNNRGVTWWQDGDDKRILFTAGSTLYSLNALTGEPVLSFGSEGQVSLKEGLDRDVSKLYVASTSPGIIYQDLFILGSRVSENSDAAPGHIRAFDVRTGKVVWTFHTIPHPGEFGYSTWPEDAWQRVGGANSWSGLSLDEERGMVFVPTGSASFDFWGGNRKGENLFANCVLALNARTGERIWHYQTVHHDIWDRDHPSPPNLITVMRDGKKIDAVSQSTKSGYVFVLDRETGEPLFPVEEVPVPASDLEGEETWPTQPRPVLPPPFSRQSFTEADINTLFPQYVGMITDILKATRTGEPFIAPSEQGTMIFPGYDGGAEWGGQAWDPTTGWLYVNANEMPWIQHMVRVEKAASSATGLLADAGRAVYQANCVACHGPDRKGNVTGNFPSLLDLKTRLVRDEVLTVINKGRGFMPGFGQLKDKEKDALLAFLLDEDTRMAPEDAHEMGLESNLTSVPFTFTGYNRFLTPEGYPAIKPPWGTLNAIDLNKGGIVWQVPLGEFDTLTQMGIPKTGSENYGGPLVTAGGLVFIAATRDECIRAFDKTTGEELWKYKLPAGGYATPSSYMIDGTQYIVIACGGGKMGTPSGDSYLAFRL